MGQKDAEAACDSLISERKKSDGIAQAVTRATDLIASVVESDDAIKETLWLAVFSEVKRLYSSVKGATSLKLAGYHDVMTLYATSSKSESVKRLCRLMAKDRIPKSVAARLGSRLREVVDLESSPRNIVAARMISAERVRRLRLLDRTARTDGWQAKYESISARHAKTLLIAVRDGVKDSKLIAILDEPATRRELDSLSVEVITLIKCEATEVNSASPKGKAGQTQKRGRRPATEDEIKEACEVWIAWEREHNENGKSTEDFCAWWSGEKKVGRVSSKWLNKQLALIRKLKREEPGRIPTEYANQLKPLRRVKRTKKN